MESDSNRRRAFPATFETWALLTTSRKPYTSLYTGITISLSEALYDQVTLSVKTRRELAHEMMAHSNDVITWHAAIYGRSAKSPG